MDRPAAAFDKEYTGDNDTREDQSQQEQTGNGIVAKGRFFLLAALQGLTVGSHSRKAAGNHPDLLEKVEQSAFFSWNSA
jgi:hypothetical protein